MVPRMVDRPSAGSAERPLVMVSNRGPVSFRHDEAGEIVARRGAGGLVSGIGPLMAGTGAVWVAAAMSDADREVAATGVTDVEGFRFRALAVDPDAYRAFYDVIANAALWFVHHGLYDRARRPVIDRQWWAAWAAYGTVNQAFAEGVAEVAPEGAVVLVQDLHLCLLAEPLAVSRPDLDLVHFSHTPFAGPDDLRVLPDEPRTALLRGMAGHRACGFHTDRWRDAFVASCRADGVEPPATFVSPLGPDVDDIGGVAAGPACAAALADIEETLGDRRFIARVDRIELSKNLVRGFLAYEDLLDRRPEWRERVVFGAYVYPSREGLPEYLAYRTEVEGIVARINDRFATADWTPVLYDATDDFPRSVAALRRADVVLVNPIRDGLNLVAKEAAVVNERDGVLVLSPEAGAWDELADAVIPCHPFDITGTADALHEALGLEGEARRGPVRPLAATVHGPQPRRLAGRQPGRRRLTTRWEVRPAIRGGSTRPWGPSTTMSARSSNSGGASGLSTAMRSVATPRSASSSRASKPGRSPTSSPAKATAAKSSARSSTAVPLSTSIGGCSSQDMRAGRATSPDR